MAAKKPISENIMQFSTKTSKNSADNCNWAPNNSAKSKIIAEEIKPRNTAASTLPITKASGITGAIIYSSKLL